MQKKKKNKAIKDTKKSLLINDFWGDGKVGLSAV